MHGAAAALLAAALGGAQLSDPAPPGSASSNVEAGQITSARPGVEATQVAPIRSGGAAPAQIAHPGRTAEAPPPLSKLSEGRNTHVVTISGRDRCDPANQIPADRAECARLAAEAQQTIREYTPPVAPEVRPDADATNLVTDIVNGGTGTVVPLPPPR